MLLEPIATSIVDKLQQAGHIAYFAGGWVRDFLMDNPSDDIDIATSASTEEIAKLFPKTIPVGVAFGIIVVVEQGHHFEVASFRKEEGYVDGRRPTQIYKASPEEDAQRRDFTINGMFYDPIEQKLYDFVGGQKDLQKKVIRAIGSPHARFLEDRLRMMRAVRYSTRFNFPIESDTLQALLSNAKSLLPAVALERIWQEFQKMSQFAHFDTGLITLHQLGILPTIFPSLQGVAVEEVQQRLTCLQHYPKKAPAILELLELFPSESVEGLIEICQYLKVSGKEKDLVRTLFLMRKATATHRENLQHLEAADWARLYADSHSDLCLHIIASRLPISQREEFLEYHTKQIERLQQAILRIQASSPIVRSEDLKNAGIQPGPLMGKLLKEAERISINHHLENRDEILRELKNSSLWPSTQKP